jgi:hypothetical protein
MWVIRAALATLSKLKLAAPLTSNQDVYQGIGANGEVFYTDFWMKLLTTGIEDNTVYVGMYCAYLLCRD